jgi:hypothetical protein
MVKTSADDSQRALVIINTDLESSQKVRIEDVRRWLGNPTNLRDISPECAPRDVPDRYEECLEPARCVAFYGEK